MTGQLFSVVLGAIMLGVSAPASAGEKCKLYSELGNDGAKMEKLLNEAKEEVFAWYVSKEYSNFSNFLLSDYSMNFETMKLPIANQVLEQLAKRFKGKKFSSDDGQNIDELSKDGVKVVKLSINWICVKAKGKISLKARSLTGSEGGDGFALGLSRKGGAWKVKELHSTGLN
jgi:hypothetical protein